MWFNLVFLSVLLPVYVSQEPESKVDDDYPLFGQTGPGGACNTPLSRRAVFSASSSYGPGKGPENAKFNARSQNAWSPLQSDFSQFLLIDLGESKQILSITTSGRPNTADFVRNYTLDYGESLDQMIAYVDHVNLPKLFHGNSESISLHRNDLPHSIIARYVRVNPSQWNHMIALRVEVLGCGYANDVASFDGESFLRIDLTFQPIIATDDRLYFRFKTINSDGLIIYSQGFQGDILLVQLVRSKLLVTIGLGGGKATTVICGTAMDDGIWHALSVARDEYRLEIWLDGVLQLTELDRGYYKLNLEKELFIGGMARLNSPHVLAKRNFQGCLERLRFNNTNVIWQLKHLNPPGFERIGNINFFCADLRVDTLTFSSIDAFIKIPSPSEQNTVNSSFCLRTYEPKAQILRKDFVNYGFVQVLLDRGEMKLWLQMIGLPHLVLEPFPGITVNDGAWHCCSLIMRTNSVVVKLDEQTSTTRRLLSFQPKPEYLFGGDIAPEDARGFRGCLRNLVTEGHEWDISNLKAQQSSFVTLNECKMHDRCTPDPCHHGGRCYQTWDQFYCDCSQTGYTGAICKTSPHPLACEEYRQYHPLSREAQIVLDVDGSGNLAPFPVLCKFEPGGRTEVRIHHDSMEESTVNGFQPPASYVQTIHYNASWSQMTALINQSYSCRQSGKYSCRNSKLLNTPIGPPFGFWISRANRQMEAWAGASSGIASCTCGLTESCYDRTRGCNCDADDDPLRSEFLTDEGWFGPKDYLPVRRLAFGDTGSFTDYKESRYQLGPLICEGNYLMDNTVTFWRQDATLLFPNFNFIGDGDIYFQFRTTVESGVLIHAKGQRDELRISLVSPTELQFLTVSANGPKAVSVQTTRRLNDNMWHSVLAERNRQEARLRVDGAFGADLKTLDEVFHPLNVNGQMTVGASADLSNGFVGCMRTLMVNGVLQDLRSFVEAGTYGIVPGCVGKCDSNPCFNGGVCMERYDQYRCDCRFTAFRGPLCSDEIGAHFRAEDFVVYDFTSPISTVAERIRVGFVTSEPRGILLQVNGDTGDYITVEMSNAGTIRVAFDIGFERQEIYEESEYYPNGQFHDVIVWRTNSGRTVNVQVDDHEIVSRTYRIESKQDSQLNNIKTIYLGRNYSMHGREGFIGCLSRASFDDFFILKQLFQQNPPANVKANRRLREDWCDVQPVSHPEEIIPPRPDMLVPYAAVPMELGSDSVSGDYQVFLGVLLATIIVVVVTGGALFGRLYVKRNGRQGAQEHSELRYRIVDEPIEPPVADTNFERGSSDF